MTKACSQENLQGLGHLAGPGVDHPRNEPPALTEQLHAAAGYSQDPRRPSSWSCLCRKSNSLLRGVLSDFGKHMWEERDSDERNEYGAPAVDASTVRNGIL